MELPQSCPSRAEWREILEGNAPEPPGHLDGCPICQAVVERLTGGAHTWLEIAEELRRPPTALPPAFRRVLDDLAHEFPTNFRRPNVPACIHVERMPHRNSIAVNGESALGYLLLKLIPTGLQGVVRPPVNLALVLDVSGSMYDEDGTGVSRLQRVQDAAVGALRHLDPADTLTIVGFAHDARLLLPPTPLAEREKIEAVLRGVDRFDIDPGGTAMDEGVALALDAVEKQSGVGKVSQIVVLTDGETSGEQNCRTLARQAAAKHIRLTLMGVGLDWKASLIKDLANLGQGKWYYIDAAEAAETARIFGQEFANLAATAFLGVRMRLRPMKDVRIKRLRQVAPEIREVKLEDADGRTLSAELGDLPQGAANRYILDVSLPRRPDGKYVLAHLDLSYDLGAGRHETTGETPLEMTYTAAGNGHVNAEVMKHIDEIQFQAMSEVLRKALDANDSEAAKRAAQEMANKGDVMGPGARKKTILARQVLQELNGKGVVARKTQLALDDAARIAELPT